MPILDHPGDEADAIQTLRANLRTVADALHDLLEHGPPLRGRNAHERDAYAQWIDDRWRMVQRAREALDMTSDFSLSSIAPPSKGNAQ
ncbi:MAG: hypothetical protein ACOYBR_09550 [Fluviibacter sp.]